MQYVSRNGCTFPNAKYLQLYAVYMQKGKIFFASPPRPDSFIGHLGHTPSDSSLRLTPPWWQIRSYRLLEATSNKSTPPSFIIANSYLQSSIECHRLVMHIFPNKYDTLTKETNRNKHQ
jgi:hypothetical protein